MTTAVELMSNVFMRANFESTLSSFSTSQSFPYNMALSCLNRAVDELNSYGRYRFMVGVEDLTYSVGDNTYSLSTLGIDAEGITQVERNLEGYAGNLDSCALPFFRARYRRAATQTAMPTAWTDYGDVLEFNTIPDQDYEIKVWHIPVISRKSATSDVIEIPERYQFVLSDMAYAWLLETVGRQDFAEKYSLATKSAKTMLTNDHTLRSRPIQMPRAF